ncbi:protein FAM136A-like [Dreissena polymorpha]|uniref:protein FAM136A-like n=1 Tax=Dreissena polymorpha TaxID=45954 RepID=UPI002263C5DC|nr:protein FAM136A-like [Dreissena polymorpha]
MDAGMRIQNESVKMMERLDKEVMRKLQGETFRCSAKCCDDTTSSMNDVQRCMNMCAAPMEKLQSQVESETQQYQSRLSRCVQNCQDQMQDRLGSNSNVTAAMKAEAESCVNACADSFIGKLPELEKRIKSVLLNH